MAKITESHGIDICLNPTCPDHKRETFKVDDYDFVCPDERHTFPVGKTYLGGDKKRGFILRG